MATRAQVPRADGESSIGVPIKKWGNIFAYKIDEATDIGNNASLGYRQPSTTYAVGTVKHNASLPTGMYLECTTAGTTGSGALTITSPTVDGTVSDGTVTWTVRQVASTKNLEGFVNDGINAVISGIRRKTSGSYMQIIGGTGISTCPYLELKGPLNTSISEGQRGGFALVAQNSENTSALVGTVNGVLTWNGNSLDKSAVVAESLGTDASYVKYNDGHIVQWGQAFPAGASEIHITLPVSFTAYNRYKPFAIAWKSPPIGVSVDNMTSTGFDIVLDSATSNTILWFVIGY